MDSSRSLVSNLLISSTFLNAQPNAFSSIKDILTSVVQEAHQLQAYSQKSLNDLDSTLEEVNQSLALKDEALIVFKSRIEGEIQEFQRDLGEQLVGLQKEFEMKMIELNREISMKEHEWNDWRMKAKTCTDMLDNEAKNVEMSVKKYTTEVNQLKLKRDALEHHLKSRLSNISSVLEAEYIKEQKLHEQIEAALMSKIALLHAQSDSELQECEMRWAHHCKEIEKVVLDLYDTFFVSRQS